MTPAALTARAKQLAIPVASCAAARIGTDHLLRDASRDQLRALVDVLAAAADPAKLLRRAHAEFTRLERAGKPVPLALRDLDSEYQAERRRQRKAKVPRPPADAPAVAAAIRQRRRDAGMSQQALAAAAGVSQSCLSLYESGARTPRAKTWRQLELTLGPLGIVRESAVAVTDAATKEGQDSCSLTSPTSCSA